MTSIPIKAICFDFGGTIDSPGVHTRNVYYTHFLLALKDLKLPLESFSFSEEELRVHFQNCYTKADQNLNYSGEARFCGLFEMNLMHTSKLIYEFRSFAPSKLLSFESDFIKRMATKITELQSGALTQAEKLLKSLRSEFQETNFVIVSNFCGNLEVILKEFSLYPLFTTVIDSFHFGRSKPHFAPFLAALDSLSISGKEAIFIGDSIERDLIPAKKLSMTTIHIKTPEDKTTGDSSIDFTIHSLEELPLLLRKIIIH